MENGVEALKLASSVLIFVIAITITISAFTMAVQALNRIFIAQDSIEYVKDADGNYLNFVRFDGGTREVGVETIIPSIYRAYKENYTIYFYKENASGVEEPLVLYTKDNGEEVNYIDLVKEVYASPEKAIESINKLLYEDGLYQRLQGKTFIEKLGEYYMDDVGGETSTAEVNKIKKRVIAYIQK